MRLIALANQSGRSAILPSDMSLFELVHHGRESIRRQYKLVCEIADTAANAAAEFPRNEQYARSIVGQQNTLDSFSALKIALKQAREDLQSATLRRQVAERSLTSWTEKPAARDGVHVVAAAIGALLTILTSVMWLHSSSVPFSAALVLGSVLLGVFGVVRYWAKRTKLASEAERAQSHERAGVSAVDAIYSELEEYNQEFQRRKRDAQRIFEYETLRNRAYLMPFPALRKAEVGDIARFKQDEVEQQLGTGRRVIILDSMSPLVSGDTNERMARWSLCKVVKKTRDEIVLSLSGAYLERRSVSATGD